MNLIKALIAAAEGTAGIYFVEGEEADGYMSYQDLLYGALRTLGALQQAGVCRGEELIIQSDNSRELLLVFWACLLGGIVPVPVSSGMQAEQKNRLLQVFACMHAGWWTCDERQRQRVSELAGVREHIGTSAALERRYLCISDLVQFPVDGVWSVPAEGDLAYIQFSSGSTGTPKGVQLTYNNLAYNILDIIEGLKISSSDILLSWMPLTHDMGLIGFHLTGVMKGVTAVCIQGGLFIRNPLVWMLKTAQYKASVLYSPNFGLQYFLSSLSRKRPADLDLSSIRIIVNGAEPVSGKICDAFTAALAPYGLHPNAIVTAYGLAEAAVAVSIMPPGTPRLEHHLNRQQLNIGDMVQYLPSGTPGAAVFADLGPAAGTVSLRICDDADHVLAENRIGHIQIKGPNVTAGYYNNTTAGAALYTADGWLKTGDLGFLRNGRLAVTGRYKNIIIINGQNYYPADIEQIIINREIAAPGKVAVTGGGGEEEEVVVFVLHKGDQAAFAPVKEQVKQAVRQDAGILVHQVIAVRQLPKTTSGKVRHSLLAAQYRAGDFDALKEPLGFTAATDVSVTDTIIRIATTLTGDHNIGTETPLFSAAISSLMAIRIVHGINRALGCVVPVQAVFQYPSPAALAEYIASADDRMARLPLLHPGTPADSYRLTAAQQRMFIESHLSGPSTAYNIPVCYLLDEMPDIPRLENAFRKLIQRYAILRTSFPADADEPVQRIHPYTADLFTIACVDTEAHAAAPTAQAFVNRYFDLSKPAQYRMALLKSNDGAIWLLFTIHHLLVDGWSLKLLFTELFSRYHGTWTQEDEAVPQYGDYVDWCREVSVSPHFIAHKNFWQAALKDLPVPVGLTGTAVGKPSLRRLGHHTHTFSPAAWQILKTLATAGESSLFTVLFSLTAALYYRYTGKQDIVLGYDTAGRVEGLENLAGYTLNTLFLRLGITPHTSFSDLLTKVKENLAAGIAHQLYPFEDMLADNGGPLFDIMLLYQDYHHAAIPGRRLPVFTDNGFIGLLFDFVELDGCLQLEIHYDTALYNDTFIQRYCRHLMNLLEGAAAGPTLPLGSYCFLTEEERMQLLIIGSGIPAPLAPDLPVHLQVAQQALLRAGAVAVIAGDSRLTYHQLNEQANIVANALRSNFSIRPGDRIGIMTGRNEFQVTGLLAIMKTGAAYVPLDSRNGQERLDNIYADGLLLVLTDEMVCEALTSSAATTTNPLYEGTPDDPAYVVYTSGSTGKPKGVVVSHRSLAHYVQQFSDYFRITPDDRVLQQSSLSFDTMVEEIFPALCNGGRVVIAPEGGRDIAGMLDIIAQQKITVLSATPGVLRLVNESEVTRLSSLRTIISGGDVLRPADIDRLINQADIYNTYGPSEAVVCASYMKVSVPLEASLIGRPIAGYKIYLLDESLQLLPAGCVGEICIEGPVAKGYLHMPAHTAEKFPESPFNKDMRMYRSGDLGRWSDTGCLEFRGRRDDQVKIRGMRVETGEVEAAISKHDAIRSVAVIAGKYKADEWRLAAFVVPGDAYDEEMLRNGLQQLLPGYMIPDVFIVLSVMPVNGHGKTDRHRLEMMLTPDIWKQSSGVRVAPESSLEQQLAVIWSQLLGVEDIGVTDSFFRMGGHSLNANQLIHLVRKTTGITITLPDIFAHPTIRELACFLQLLEKTRYRTIDLF